MGGDDASDASRGGGAGVDGGLGGPDVTAHDDGDETAPGLLARDQGDVGRLRWLGVRLPCLVRPG